MTLPSDRVASGGDYDDYDDVEPLFVRLAAAEGDEEWFRLRCDIITACLPLADNIAYRFTGRGQPQEDLIQVARLGLVKAVDRYDPDKGYFVAFAVPTILGEIRRYFRDNTWAIHVSRDVKDIRQRVRTVIDPLSQRLGRVPSATDLADELEMDCRDVALALDAGDAYRPLSLDAPVGGGQTSEDRDLSSLWGAEDPGYSRVENMLAVADLLSGLSERQRAILRMRFDEGLSQAQIGERLGISQVHVSRLLTHILGELRRRISL